MTELNRWLQLALVSLPLALIGAGSGLQFPFGVASGEVTESSAVLWTAANQETALKVEVFDNANLMPPKAFQATVRSEASQDFTAKVTASAARRRRTSRPR